MRKATKNEWIFEGVTFWYRIESDLYNFLKANQSIGELAFLFILVAIARERLGLLRGEHRWFDLAYCKICGVRILRISALTLSQPSRSLGPILGIRVPKWKRLVWFVVFP